MNYEAGLLIIAAAGALGTLLVVVFSAGALKATIEARLNEFARRLTAVEHALKDLGLLAISNGGPHGHS